MLFEYLDEISMKTANIVLSVNDVRLELNKKMKKVKLRIAFRLI